MKDNKINEELKPLVESGILLEKEALLLSKIRNGELANPLDNEVAQTTSTSNEIKELNSLKMDLDEEIEVAQTTIEKFEKAIEVLSGNSLFEYNEILKTDDKIKLTELTKSVLGEIESFVSFRKENLEQLKDAKNKLVSKIEPILDFYELKELGNEIENHASLNTIENKTKLNT